MTLPRSAGDVLSDHVVFELESIDRMYLNLYVPQLQRVEGVLGFIHGHLGRPIASASVIAPMSRGFTARLAGFTDAHGIPQVDFARGQRKDDVMHEYLAAFEASGRTEGVLFLGRAREKNTVFWTGKRRAADGRPYPWIVRTTSVVNQFYIHCADEDFGAFFVKFSSYFPYGGKLLINGHHYAQAQATSAGIGFAALDNGSRRGGRPRRGAGDLRLADRGQDRGAGPQVAGHLAPPVFRRRPGRRVPRRHLRAAGRVLPHPGAGPPAVRPGLLRPGHPRQPRHRPARPGRSHLRAPHRRQGAARHPRPVPHPGIRRVALDSSASKYPDRGCNFCDRRPPTRGQTITTSAESRQDPSAALGELVESGVSPPLAPRLWARFLRWRLAISWRFVSGRWRNICSPRWGFPRPGCRGPRASWPGPGQAATDPGGSHHDGRYADGLGLRVRGARHA